MEGLLAWTYRYAPKVPLQMDSQLPTFNTAAPLDLAALKADLEVTLGEIGELIREQRALLEKIAVSELERQRAQLTRYLIDARFALAREYDKSCEELSQ